MLLRYLTPSVTNCQQYYETVDALHKPLVRSRLWPKMTQANFPSPPLPWPPCFFQLFALHPLYGIQDFTWKHPMACFSSQVKINFNFVIFPPNMSPIPLQGLGFSFGWLPEVKIELANWPLRREAKGRSGPSSARLALSAAHFHTVSPGSLSSGGLLQHPWLACTRKHNCVPSLERN